MRLVFRHPQSFLNVAIAVVIAALLVVFWSRPESIETPEVRIDTQKSGSQIVDERPANSDWLEAERLIAEQSKESTLRAVEFFVRAGEFAKHEKQFDFAARAFRQAANARLVLGETKEAFKLLVESVALAKSAGDMTEEGFCQAALAYAYFLLGDSKATKKSSLRALELARSVGNQHLEALALSTLGEASYSAGDLKLAQDYQQQALGACQRIGDQKCQTRAAVALGYYLVNLSEPRKAIDFFAQGLLLAVQSNDLQGQAQSLNAIGNIKLKIGEHQGALNAFNSARPLAERTGDRICLASTLGGTSGVYRFMGDLPQALRFITESLAIFESIDEKWGIAEAKLDQGRILKMLGKYDEASTRLHESLALFQSFGMKRLEMQTLAELAAVQRSMGQLDEAQRTYEKSLSLSKAGQDQRHEAYILNNLGEIYSAQGKSDRALELHRKASTLSVIAADPIEQLNSLVSIARIERDQGRLEDAKREIEAATTLAESVRARVSSPNLRTSYLASVHQAYELGIDTLMLLHEQQPTAQLDEQAFVIGEKARARSFQEEVLDGRASFNSSVDPALLERERSLSEQLNSKAERQMKLLAAKDRVEAAKLDQEIETLTGQYNEVQDQIRAANPVAAALTTSHPLSVKEVQAQVIEDDSALLTFSLGEERSYAWVVTKGEAKSYVLAGRKAIEEVAGRLYESLTAQQARPGDGPDDRYARQRAAAEVMPVETRKLSKMLLEQFIGGLQGKRLLVVTDGALQLIPFATLVNPDTGELLVKSHEIMVEPSASALAVIKKAPSIRQTPTRSVLVFADPVFEPDDPRIKRLASYKSASPRSQQAGEVLRDIGLSEGGQIPRLFASGREADAIIAALPWKSGRKAVDFSANREGVLSDEVASYQILHFATHGASNSEHPELSGIVLSLFDQNGQPREGVLRLHDIYDLHVRANLVVLSACSSGLGKDVRGEGLISLTRGFMHAGAKSVVASLWKVDDEATAELMGHFYNGIFQRRLTPAAALRFAQLEMAKQTRWQSPYYWAGFVIQGQDLSNEAITQNVSWSRAEVAVMTASVAVMLLMPGVLLWLRRRRGLS
jgi:CHAT domain-containing protein